MHHMLGDLHGPWSHLHDQQQLAHRINYRPHPGASRLKEPERLFFTDLALSDATQYGIQLIELELCDVHVTQEIACKSLELLSSLHQPLQHGVGIDLEDPCGGTDTQSFSQTAQDTHDQLRRQMLAMNNRSTSLKKIPLAGAAVQPSPGPTAGMTVGAEVVQAHPAAIVAAVMRAKVHRGVDGTRASVGGRHRVRPSWRRRLGMVGIMFTGSARGALGETRKQFGLARACAF